MMDTTLSGYFDVPVQPAGSDIDIYASFQGILRQKRLIAVIASVVTACALGYALFATPIYQATSTLRPAAVNELDALNRTNIYNLPPGAALSKVAASLSAYEMRLNFFRDNEALFGNYIEPGRPLEENFEAFNKAVPAFEVIDTGTVEDFNRTVELKVSYPQGLDGVRILNGFVDYAIEVERQNIAADLNVLIKNRISEIKGKIDFARSTYQIEKETRVATLQEADNLKRARLQDELKALRLQLKILRGDRISQLNEAITIARSLGIRKPSSPSALADSGLSGAANVIRTEVNSQQAPLYFLGTDALEAELSTLQKRVNDDFTGGRIAEIAKELQLLQANREVEILRRRSNEDLFLRDVQGLRAEEARLSSLGTDYSRVQLVSVDQRAIPPDSPLKPKRLLVVMLGVVFGLVAGVLVAFIRYQFSVMKARSHYLRSKILDVQVPASLSQGESVRIG